MSLPCYSSPTQLTYSMSPPISHVFEFTLHEHAGLSMFVPLFLKMAVQEGNKKLNIILYYSHVFIDQKTLIL